MISVADHSIVRRPVKVGRDTKMLPGRATPDEEVTAITEWLSRRVEKITRGESPITYRELRQIVGNFGFSVQPLKNMKVAICAAEGRRGLFRRTPRQNALMSLDWPGDGRTVSIRQIKHIRKTLGLREEDGVTRETFYGKGVRVDRFINDYRLVLRQLASR